MRTSSVRSGPSRRSIIACGLLSLLLTGCGDADQPPAGSDPTTTSPPGVSAPLADPGDQQTAAGDGAPSTDTREAIPRSSGSTLPKSDTAEPFLQDALRDDPRKVAFSLDGTHLLSATTDGNVALWDLQHGQQVRGLDFHEPRDDTFCFSGDGGLVAVSGYGGTLYVRKMESGEPPSSLDGLELSSGTLAISADGSLLAASTGTHTVMLWEVKSGNRLRELEHEVTNPDAFGYDERIRFVTFSSDGTRLFSGTEDGYVTIWNVETGEQVRRWKAHEQPVLAVAACADLSRLFTRSENGTLTVWNNVTGEAHHTFGGEGEADRISAAALSADGSLLATAEDGGRVVLRNTETGDTVRELPFAELPSVEARTVAFSRDGSRIAIGSSEGIVIREIPGGELRHHFGFSRLAKLSWCAVTGDGQQLDVSAGGYGRMVFDLKSGKVAHVISSSDFHKADAISGEGTLAVRADEFASTVTLFEPRTGKPIRKIPGRAFQVAIDHSGTRLLTTTADNEVILWNAGTGEKLHTMRGHRHRIADVAISRDGRRAASCDIDVTIVWDLEAGTEIRSLRSPGVAVALNADGTRLFSGTSQETLVWNVESGEKLDTLPWGADSLVLRDSGNTLIGSTYAHQGAKIYSLDRAELLAELHVFAGSRGAFEKLRDWLVITPDGRFDGSPEAIKRIAFRRPGTSALVAPEPHLEKFYSPGLLAEIFSDNGDSPPGSGK